MTALTAPALPAAALSRQAAASAFRRNLAETRRMAGFGTALRGLPAAFILARVTTQAWAWRRRVAVRVV